MLHLCKICCAVIAIYITSLSDFQVFTQVKINILDSNGDPEL